MADNPYAKYQQPASTGATDPYAKYQQPAQAPTAAPETPWYDHQLIHPETWFDDAKDADPNSIGGGLRHIIHGGLKSAGAMTTPKNIGITAALAAANLVPVLGEVADAYAVGNGLLGTGNAAIDVAKKVKAGDYAGAEESAGEALPGAAGTGAAFLHAGSPGLVERGTEGFGNAMQKGAPSIAESALRVSRKDRAYDRLPGQAIIDDTTGFTPAKVKETGQTSVNNYRNEVAQIAQHHANSGGLVDLSSPRNFVKNRQIQAEGAENNPKVTKRAKEIQDFYSTNAATGTPIPVSVPAPDAIAMGKGLQDRFTSFIPDADNTNDMRALGNGTYHWHSDAINKQVPDIEVPRDKLASLIPVLKRADSQSRADGLFANIMDKARKPTGALTSTVAGAGAGGLAHGLPGAVIGGLAGLIGPQILASDASQLVQARGLNGLGKLTVSAAPSIGRGLGLAPIALPYGLRKDDNEDEDR